MAKFQTGTNAVTGRTASMGVMDAIYERRAVRSYKQKKVMPEDIKTLLSAAVQAPTAIHEEPWAFAIIQDGDLLEELSNCAKGLVDDELHNRLPDLFEDPAFNVFYNAGTLIVIYGREGAFSAADCWLAAENLMLSACAMGFGTCVIGMAIEALNTPEWKKKLGIPSNMVAYVPIILGVPEGEIPSCSRKEPEIIVWK